MDRENNMLLWSIFGIAVLTMAVVPSAWGMLGRTAGTGVVKNANMAQTLWGQSPSVSQYVQNKAQDEQVSIIPGALTPSDINVTWNTAAWPPSVTISGYGFGNPPSGTKASLVIADQSRGWVAGNASKYDVQTQVASWTNNEIDITGFTNYGSASLTSWANGMGSWVFAPGDMLTLQITNPQTGTTKTASTTYPLNAPMPTVSIDPVGSPIASQQVTMTGHVSFAGQPLANQAVALSVTGGQFTGGGTQVSSTEYIVFTNSSGLWSANYVPPMPGGTTQTVTASADSISQSQSFDVLPMFTVSLTASANQTNNNVTLTATVNRPLSGYTLEIINQVTGQVVASTTQGTSLTTQITAVQQQTESFIAEVK